MFQLYSIYDIYILNLSSNYQNLSSIYQNLSPIYQNLSSNYQNLSYIYQNISSIYLITIIYLFAIYLLSNFYPSSIYLLHIYLLPAFYIFSFYPLFIFYIYIVFLSFICPLFIFCNLFLSSIYPLYIFYLSIQDKRSVTRCVGKDINQKKLLNFSKPGCPQDKRFQRLLIIVLHRYLSNNCPLLLICAQILKSYLNYIPFLKSFI